MKKLLPSVNIDTDNKTMVSVFIALIAIVSAVAYIIHATQERAYKEKWDYYNDCGIGSV